MRRLALALLLLVCAAVGAFAQATEGSIRGFVRDEQGGVLPGVVVSATSPDVAGVHTAVTDQEGYYRLLNLPPATYTVGSWHELSEKDVRETTQRVEVNDHAARVIFTLPLAAASQRVPLRGMRGYR